MSVLLDPRGPFYKCDMQKHRDPEHLEPKKGPGGLVPGRTDSASLNQNSEGPSRASQASAPA